MNNTEIKKYIQDWISENKEEFSNISDFIWANPELGLEEYEACGKLCGVLEKYGFTVEKGLAGMPTAFIATYGSQGPVIGLNAEYDGLPGLSQDASSCQKSPIMDGAPGHGCGHNLLGAAAVLAAVALSKASKQYAFDAVIKVFGSPAEEQCLGKAFMGRAGLYEGVDFFLDWHPWNYNRADYDTCNAYFNIKYHYEGKTSHGNSPWHGRSALDAAMLSGHAIEMLREHFAPAGPDAANTINYNFPNVGPEFPSVVPDRTTMWVIGRFTTAEQMEDIIERIDKCAEAGALATGTTVSKQLITATHDKIPNKTLAEIVHKNMSEMGPLPYTEADQEYIKKIQQTEGMEPVGLDMKLKEFGPSATALCDTSEFSWNAPYATFWMAIAPVGGWHHWMITACSGSDIGRKAVAHASGILASSAVDILLTPGTIEKAKAELQERLGGRVYKSLVPEDIKPPLGLNKATMEKYKR